MNSNRYINIFSFLFFFIIFSVCPIRSAEAYGASTENNFTVIIDAGHGGRDFGAVDNNVKEKDINLGVAKKLASKIKKGLKNVTVVLTRNNDSFITLQERADIANDKKGNLFISIHTNSVDKTNPKRRSISGASVYALGLHKDKNNLQVARRENSVIELEKNFEQKYSGFDPSKDESYIIFEMAQKKNLGESLKFADMAQKSLVKEAGRADRGVKQAGFWVLWATSMPSVLIELDFICNPNSAVYMASEKGQGELAEALYKALKKYIGKKQAKSITKNQVESNTEQYHASAEQTAAPVVTSSRIENKKIENSTISSRPVSAFTKRRRRSEAAKKASAIRNVETASIPLHKEDERLAIIEIKENWQESSVEKSSMAADTKKKKGGKEDKKKQNKKKNNRNTRTYNNKPVIVNAIGSTSQIGTKANLQTSLKTHKSISGYHSKVEKLTTVYKIQILASSDLLKQNNPRFCGLNPVKSFKENNLYKYTFGESENRQDMENLLVKIKEIIPDAFIIKSQK